MNDVSLKPRATPSVAEAVAPFLLLVILFAGGVTLMDMGDALIVISMLGAACMAGVTAARLGHGWAEIQSAIVDKVTLVFPIMLILLAIGGLIGTWMLSGTIPAFVWVGLKLIDPGYIVLTAFFASALMSIFTGTSWGSAGTVGVALMGIAIAQEAPVAAVAGAIVSGAYFGDKMSPLSDTTNVAALSARAELYTHIRHMTYTAVPSFLIAAMVYALVFGGSDSTGEVSGSSTVMMRDIESAFELAWFAYLPPFVVLLAIWRKWPPVLGIAASAAFAGFIGVTGQGFSIDDALRSATTGFDTAMIERLGGNAVNPSEAFNSLANRGGVYSMVNTFVVIIAAFILGGTMEASGALKVVVGSLLTAAKSVFSLVATTMLSSVMMLSLTSHGGVTCLIIGGVFQEGYKKRKLAPENLSRTLEDSVTLLDPLLPWTVSGLFMASTLGVPTLEYLLWALFCLGGPVFSLLLAFQYRHTGLGLTPISKKS